jgi:hypothetical protein
MLAASPACLINHWYGHSRAAALHEFHFSIVWPITITALGNVTPCSFVDGTNVSKESVACVFRVEEVNTVLPWWGQQLLCVHINGRARRHPSEHANLVCYLSVITIWVVGVRFQGQGQGILFFAPERPVRLWCQLRLVFSGYRRRSYPKVKRPGSEADYSPPFSEEGKNQWSYNFTAPMPL